MNKFMSARVWNHGLSHPIYVPQDFQDVQILLSEGRISAACDALWRRATLGSDTAAAILGYMNLRHVVPDAVESSDVTQRCVDAANRNDGFAQYVVAWQAYETGDFQTFAKWLERSARQLFLPAIADMGRYAVQTPRASVASRPIAKKSLWIAFKRGHVISASYFLRSCAKGQFGFHFRFVGLVGFPLALILLVPILRLCPFSISVFSYPLGTKKPLFSSSVFVGT
jgi:hypothetical protein